MNSFSLDNKTILITGASSGIGQSCAQRCSEAGASVLLLARNKERLQKTSVSLKGTGHQIYPLDLTDFEAVETFSKDLKEKDIKVDGIVHAAGLTLTYPFKYAGPKKLEEVFQTNVFAAYELTRWVVKNAKSKGMSIVFISSVMASVGEKAKSVYSMSKGAILSGARSLSIELASQKMRVNTVSPGVIETPMTKNATYKKSETAYQKILEKHPLGRLGKPDDVAHACIFLLSDESEWITGTDIKVDGGYTAQ